MGPTLLGSGRASLMVQRYSRPVRERKRLAAFWASSGSRRGLTLTLLTDAADRCRTGSPRDPPATSATGSAHPPTPESPRRTRLPRPTRDVPPAQTRSGRVDPRRCSQRRFGRSRAMCPSAIPFRGCGAATREEYDPHRSARLAVSRPSWRRKPLRLTCNGGGGWVMIVSLRRGMIVLCLARIGLPRCDVSSVWLMQCWWGWGRCWARVCSLLGDRRPQPQALVY